MCMLDIKNRAQIRVRYAETDKMGVVYNGNYFTYFEIGRAELMRSHNMEYAKIEEAGYFLPLLETGAKYKQSAYYDDLLEIEAHCKWNNSPIMRFEYNVWRGDELICEGFTVHSFLSAETRKPVKPPKVFIDIVNEYLESQNNK